MEIADIKISIAEDKPLTGMWPVGYNSFWITATHLPTMTAVRVYSGQRRKSRLSVRETAVSMLELLVEDVEPCRFKERVNDL